MDIKDLNSDQIYAYATSLIQILSEFREILINNYAQDFFLRCIIFILQLLIIQIKKKSNKLTKIDIDFIINNNLIYYVTNIKRLCILIICEKIMFELVHDQNNHARFY